MLIEVGKSPQRTHCSALSFDDQLGSFSSWGASISDRLFSPASPTLVLVACTAPASITTADSLCMNNKARAVR